MTRSYCFWSVADGEYADMFAAAIRSARQVGVFKEFHVWSDRSVPGAVNHRVKNIDKRFGMFKFRFLRERVAKLDFEYFVWLDADSWFVRDPGDPLTLLQGAPIHATLESNASNPKVASQKWYGCRLERYAELMDIKGVCSKTMFTCNAGFWIVHRDAVETACSLAADFWMSCHRKGQRKFREEPALAYAMQMLCGNPYAHTFEHAAHVWAPDRSGHFRRSLPQGKAWSMRDPFTAQTRRVNPAIVHLLHGKKLLARLGSKPATRR